MRITRQGYPAYIASQMWREVIRPLVGKRDQWRCRECHHTQADGWVMQVHHLTYDHVGDEMGHLDDLAMLCVPCHSAKHPGRDLGAERTSAGRSRLYDDPYETGDDDEFDEASDADAPDDAFEGCPFDPDDPSGDDDDGDEDEPQW